MKRVLLTGAGGFVGHHCLEHLLVETDWEVVCLDSFRHRGKTDRIREVLDGQPISDRVTVLPHDLRVPISDQLDHKIGPINFVLSIASESHVDRSCVEPRPFVENNVALVLTLLEWARHRARLGPDGVQKFLHVSTDEVYGPAPARHDHVEGEPHRPSNPYSASKAAQEDIVYSYWRTYGLPVGISNTMNIIGERQDPEKFVPLVLARVLAGERVPIHASAEGQPGSRFYLHARNQADALRFLLETQPFRRYGDIEVAGDIQLDEILYDSRTAPFRVVGIYEDRTGVEIQHGDFEEQTVSYAKALEMRRPASPAEMGRWNVVGEREVDNLTMAQMIAEYAGSELLYDLVDFHTSRPGHDLRYALDGEKMGRLGWVPPVPLAESLERTVRWSLAHPEWLLEDARLAA